jgi:hypothetical protein
LVAQSFDVEEQRVLSPRELVDGRAQALELITHSVRGGWAGELAGVRGRGAVMVENLGLLERKVSRPSARTGNGSAGEGSFAGAGSLMRKGLIGTPTVKEVQALD